ncbi:MAG: protein kinase [Myxococcota bacterium]
MPPHPTIVRLYESVYGIGEQRQYDAVVVEWTDGQTLQELVEHEGPLPIDRAAHISQQVCDALLYVKVGIPLASGELLPCAHGHLGPRWVHVGDGGQVKLGGWGLFTLKPEDRDQRMHERLMTVPPESARGEQHEASYAQDVFGLGAILHFALTGRGMYGDDYSLDALVPLLRSGRVMLDPSLPMNAGRAIASLTAPKPADRPTLEQANDLLLGLKSTFE